MVIESHINLLHGESSLYHLAESITYKRVLDLIVMEALRVPLEIRLQLTKWSPFTTSLLDLVGILTLFGANCGWI